MFDAGYTVIKRYNNACKKIENITVLHDYRLNVLTRWFPNTFDSRGVLFGPRRSRGASFPK